ncbi:hypothetical protein C8Q80DRAFT_1275332 [Daedaleopsis nitida]|nr:hypothetical protein C8Q80DRAFT_1275332 [Daedaleopsis nitida]
MTALLYVNAQYIGLCVQLFVTGAYLVYAYRCAQILRKKSSEDKLSLRLWLPGVCVLMFSITITVQIVNMIDAYEAWSVKSATGRPNPTPIYADVASTMSLIKDCGTVALALISDFIMVYRTFLVWGMRIRAILIPGILLLADIAMGVWSQYTLSRTRFGNDPIVEDIAISARYFFAVTFAVNILCAGMLCWKIWHVHSLVPAEVSSMGRSPTARVFEVMIQTAALYCAHLLILVVTDRIGSNVFFVFLHPLPPVTALVFTVLIVRAHPAKDDRPPTVTTSIHFTPPWRMGGGHPLEYGGMEHDIDLEYAAEIRTRSSNSGSNPESPRRGAEATEEGEQPPKRLRSDY